MAPLPIGKIMRTIRKKRGWSQRQLAQKLGITRESVSRYEHGARTLSVPRLQTVAAALQVEEPYFFSLEDNDPFFATLLPFPTLPEEGLACPLST